MNLLCRNLWAGSTRKTRLHEEEEKSVRLWSASLLWPSSNSGRDKWKYQVCKNNLDPILLDYFPLTGGEEVFLLLLFAHCWFFFLHKLYFLKIRLLVWNTIFSVSSCSGWYIHKLLASFTFPPTPARLHFLIYFCFFELRSYRVV